MLKIKASEKPIIGICGSAGSGKDTVADYLVKKHFCSISLADPMKRMLMQTFDFTERQLWGPSEQRNAPDSRYSRTCFFCNGKGSIPGNYVGFATDCGHCNATGEIQLSPRKSLQLLGTEFGRQCYPDIWVHILMRDAKEALRGGRMYSKAQGIIRMEFFGSPPKEFYRGVVVPDCRFINEVKYIKEYGGKMIRLYRDDAGLKGEAAQHSSETELLNIPSTLFDYHLYNNSSLENLYKEVDQIFEQ